MWKSVVYRYYIAPGLGLARETIDWGVNTCKPDRFPSEVISCAVFILAGSTLSIDALNR